MYIKRFVKHYYIMLVPGGFPVATLFQYRAYVWNRDGFSGL